MNLAHVTVNERSQTHKVTCYTILSEMSGGKPPETRSRGDVARGRREEGWEWLLPGGKPDWMQNHTNDDAHATGHKPSQQLQR